MAAVCRACCIAGASVSHPALQVIYRRLVADWEGGGEAVPWCVRLLGGTLLCHFRVNVVGHLLHVLKNLDVLSVRKQDIVSFNIGLW